MTGIKWLLTIAVSYIGVMALMYLVQRAMMYFPEKVRTAPAEAGFAEAQEIVLDSAGGERVIAWHVAPRGGKPVVLYFHGNGGALRYRVARFRAIVADGHRARCAELPRLCWVERTPDRGRSHRRRHHGL